MSGGLGFRYGDYIGDSTIWGFSRGFTRVI